MIIIDVASWVVNIFVLSISLVMYALAILMVMYIINVISEGIKKWNSPV